MPSSKGGMVDSDRRRHVAFKERQSIAGGPRAARCSRWGSGGGGGLRKVGGGLEATAFVSMLASSVSSRVLWLSCNMLWNV